MRPFLFILGLRSIRHHVQIENPEILIVLGVDEDGNPRSQFYFNIGCEKQNIYLSLFVECNILSEWLKSIRSPIFR